MGVRGRRPGSDTAGSGTGQVDALHARGSPVSRTPARYSGITAVDPEPAKIAALSATREIEGTKPWPSTLLEIGPTGYFSA